MYSISIRKRCKKLMGLLEIVKSQYIFYTFSKHAQCAILRPRKPRVLCKNRTASDFGEFWVSIISKRKLYIRRFRLTIKQILRENFPDVYNVTRTWSFLVILFSKQKPENSPVLRQGKV